ncbi:MAG: FtsX-like permease family protein, partial [Acidobacteriaceae bacterium]
RESELVVRAALGAGTAALRRSLLAEGVVLCGSGVIAALLLAWPMVEVLGSYAARFSVRADGLKLDLNLVWFGIGLALAAAVFLALIPRLPSGNAPLAAGLTSGGTRVTGSGNRRLRVFAVMQIAASFLLLTGAAVLMRTLYTLEQTRPPFDTSHVLAVNLPVMSYGKTPEEIQDFYREVQRRVSELPGVAHTSTGFSVPWRDDQALDISFTFAAQGAPARNGIDWRAKFRSVSPGYFETLGLPVLGGRDFRDTDKDGAERVVIISQSLANALFPGENPLNRELRWTDPVMKFIGISYEPRRIVGVVPDLDDENIIPEPAVTVYQPVDQEGWQGRLFVRTHGDAYALVPAITRTVHEISSEEPVERASTLSDVRAEVLTPDKLNAVVFGGFAAVALLISVVGVAGVLAFSVSGRTREFGIRMALGAQPRHIMNDVLLQGLTIAGIGVGAGMLLGIAFARGIGRYVAEVHLPGLLAFAASALVILAAAVIASAVPAARAARVNAVEALRAE